MPGIRLAAGEPVADYRLPRYRVHLYLPEEYNKYVVVTCVTH